MKIPLFSLPFHYPLRSSVLHAYFSQSILLFILFLITLPLTTLQQQTSSTDIFEYIIVLKSPSEDYASPEIYFLEKIDEFKILHPAAIILQSYTNFIEFKFLAFSVQCSKNELIDLEFHFPSLKFYEESSSLQISKSLVKTIPFISQYLRSESHTLSKNGFCTFSYESYDRFKQAGIRDSGEFPLDVYVLDTGIQSSHVAFGDRVLHGFDSFSNPPLKADPNGHGTQVAGIIGGENYGLINTANLIDVRVANEDGVARIHDILSGLDYILGRFLPQLDTKGRLSSLSVMSMSGPQSRALKFALYSFSKVMFLVGAVGDQDSFSCRFSPADSPFVLTTAATLRDLDIDLPGSNFGDCIDINAPGEMIPAPWIGPSNTEMSYLSGSSASTAVITGVLGIISTVIRAHPPFEQDGVMISLNEVFSKSATADNFSILLRNILLSTTVQYLPTNRDSHPSSANYCDLRTIDSILFLALDYYRRIQTSLKATPISRVKQNFFQQQKQQLDSMYE